MSNKELLENIKKLRINWAFKDCKSALMNLMGYRQTIEFLRKKGIAKAEKNEQNSIRGLGSCERNGGEISIIEVNSETDLLRKIKILSLFAKNFQKSILFRR